MSSGHDGGFTDEGALPPKESGMSVMGKALSRKPRQAAREEAMESKGFSISFEVDESPRQVFEAINDVRGWWSGEIDGRTDELGAEFTYRYRDMHRSTQKITELVPGERVVWRVSDASLEFVEDKTEWNGTEVVFEIEPKGGRSVVRFTHVGLVPRFQCYGACSGGWSFYVNESLRSLITTGKGLPNSKEA
jgi:uncharacterized protein YndB with AHSA1/START domain